MPWPGGSGPTLAHRKIASDPVQTTIVTLDRDWSAALAQELREDDMPTLTPASPARWREHFDGARPNCIVLDLDHGGQGAFDMIATIKAQSRHTMIVTAASAPSIKLVVAAMRAGAVDFINKRQSPRLAREQIREAADHALSHQTATVEAKAYRERIEALSPREREILCELAAGLATKQIARNLELSPRTVEMFRGRIKRRLGAGTIAEAIGIWLSYRDEPRLRVVG